MRDLGDDERRMRARDETARTSVRREDCDRRTADGTRESGRPARRTETELDERERLVRIARVAEMPFG
jgi:hypothetical protein